VFFELLLVIVAFGVMVVVIAAKVVVDPVGLQVAKAVK